MGIPGRRSDDYQGVQQFVGLLSGGMVGKDDWQVWKLGSRSLVIIVVNDSEQRYRILLTVFLKINAICVYRRTVYLLVLRVIRILISP